MFDGERDLGIVRVVVRDGEISAVGADAEAPAGLTRIDGRGRTLLPGLIDAHVHAFGDAQQDMARFGVTGGLDMHGDVDLPELTLAHDPVVLVVGSEGKGLSRLVSETCDQLVSIPMASGLESLNAGVAASVALAGAWKAWSSLT